MSRYVSLTKWAQDTYGEEAPSYQTLVRWTRAGKIKPAPQKHGRTFFVHPNAVYTERPLTLVQRLAVEETHAA